jgi:hypothetical protein
LQPVEYHHQCQYRLLRTNQLWWGRRTVCLITDDNLLVPLADAVRQFLGHGGHTPAKAQGSHLCGQGAEKAIVQQNKQLCSAFLLPCLPAPFTPFLSLSRTRAHLDSLLLQLLHRRLCLLCPCSEFGFALSLGCIGRLTRSPAPDDNEGGAGTHRGTSCAMVATAGDTAHMCC